MAQIYKKISNASVFILFISECLIEKAPVPFILFAESGKGRGLLGGKSGQCVPVCCFRRGMAALSAACSISNSGF